MKKIYSVIAMAMFAMGINAQVTYDFTTVAPAPADGGGIVNPTYGEGNTTDGDHVFSIHSKTDGADIPMVYLVAPTVQTTTSALAYTTGARAGCSATQPMPFGADCGRNTTIVTSP